MSMMLELMAAELAMNTSKPRTITCIISLNFILGCVLITKQMAGKTNSIWVGESSLFLLGIIMLPLLPHLIILLELLENCKMAKIFLQKNNWNGLKNLKLPKIQ